jgi:hypothetical protein
VTRPLTKSSPPGFHLAALGGIFVSASSCSCLHDRQIAILDRPDWAAWLDPSISAKAILKRLAAGSLGVERVGKHTTSDVHERFVEWLGINLRCHHATGLAHA